MHQSLFTVRLADLERGKRHYEGELPLEWLRHTFEGTDASVTSIGSLTFEASVTSRQVLIRGRAAARVTMPCARTLDPVPVDLSAEIFLVLRPAAAGAAAKAGPSGSSAKGAPMAGSVSTGAQATKRRPARRPEVEMSEEDAAEDVYHGDTVELDGFVREFLLLELPMMPIRSDLRSEERPAIPPTPEPPTGSASSHTVDPRLQPLAAIASRLGKKNT